MKRTERPTSLGATDHWQNSKSSTLQENMLDAACLYEIHKKDGEKEQCCIFSSMEMKANPSRVTPASAAL